MKTQKRTKRFRYSTALYMIIREVTDDCRFVCDWMEDGNLMRDKFPDHGIEAAGSAYPHRLHEKPQGRFPAPATNGLW